jgi:hypothetical protein
MDLMYGTERVVSRKSTNASTACEPEGLSSGNPHTYG